MKNPECFEQSLSGEQIESKIKEAFELIEKVAVQSDLNLDISRTSYEKDHSLELSNGKRFLRLSFEAEQLALIEAEGVKAVIKLEYTAQDLRPIRGRVISERSFQGVVDRFYLYKGTWHILNPTEFPTLKDSEEILLSHTTVRERILYDVFEA